MNQKIESPEQLVVGQTVLVSRDGGEFLLQAKVEDLYMFYGGGGNFKHIQTNFTIKVQEPECCWCGYNGEDLHEVDGKIYCGVHKPEIVVTT